MAKPEDQRRKVTKIKRINPMSESQDGNTTSSTLKEGTSEVCNHMCLNTRTKSFASRLLVISWKRSER